MKLSEQLKQDHESGDFGRALEGYSERAAVLEGALQDAGVLDLLATIHRDGGHHTESVGFEQSVKDAMRLVDAWKVEP